MMPQCLKCSSSEFTYEIAGLCLICKCNNCGDVLAVTTYHPPYLHDETVYTVFVDISRNKKHKVVELLKRFGETTTAKAKDRIQRGETLILKGQARDLINEIIELRKEGIALLIEPEFKYL